MQRQRPDWTRRVVAFGWSHPIAAAAIISVPVGVVIAIAKGTLAGVLIGVVLLALLTALSGRRRYRSLDEWQAAEDEAFRRSHPDHLTASQRRHRVILVTALATVFSVLMAVLLLA